MERAFNDLHRKYERTKEVVAGFKSNEDILKRTVEDLTVRLDTNQLAWSLNEKLSRYKKGEERYEMLKEHAETKLSE